MFFNRVITKQEPPIDDGEARFQAIIDLIKDLPRKEFNKLMKATDKAYDAYQTIREVETFDEQEVSSINAAEEKLMLDAEKKVVVHE